MIGPATNVVGNTALLNHTCEAPEADAQSSVSSDKPVDVYVGSKQQPAKETEAQAQAQAQQMQQGACATKKSRFGGGFFAKHRAKRQAQKNLDQAVQAQVNGCAKGASVANLLPANQAAKGACQAQASCANSNDSLHALAKSVIKYTHTGLHLHAVNRNNTASALRVVEETQALLEPALCNKSCPADRRLKHDAKRLERHRKHLSRKLAKQAPAACAKGVAQEQSCAKAEQAAPAKKARG